MLDTLIYAILLFSRFFFPQMSVSFMGPGGLVQDETIGIFHSLFFTVVFCSCYFFWGGKFCRFLLDQETLDICEFSKGIVDNIILIPVGFWRLDLAKNTRRIHMFDRALKRN